mmetsp:Transcript_4371/g.15163  ORF Transcript_4371/g.15163 Transcript_4371/m.15163 type:complete len:304 (-) Transcript_4371:101-1012(-)
MVWPARLSDDFVAMDPDEDKVAELARGFERVNVAGVEHVKDARDIHDAVVWARRAAVGELHDAARGWAEVRQLRLFRRRRHSGGPRGGRSRLLLLRSRVRRQVVVRVADAHLLLQRRGLVRPFRLGLRARAQEHAPNNVRARNPLRPLDHFEAAELLGRCVSVRAVWKQARVVAVHDVIDPILVKELLRKLGADVVRNVRDHLVHPLDRAHRRNALLLGHHRWTLAPPNLGVVHNAHHEHIPARPRLPKRVGVPEVHQVEAPVHVHADRSCPLALFTMLRQTLRDPACEGPWLVLRTIPSSQT